MALPLMEDSGQRSAIAKRRQQLDRWDGSETNKEHSSIRKNNSRVKFPEDCVFLAACSQGDKSEVKRLLALGANINTGNVDGLTALHQACIDGKLDMVEFLTDNGAYLDVADNEGWTPLHATSNCGYLEIATYLLEHGANVVAVNNDGELPVDITDEDDMREALQSAMDHHGIDPDLARREEEETMLADANQWLKTKVIRESPHPKTGATALHVAAAKGYIKVMNVLFQAGVDSDLRDMDGWSPLHAAAHWGQDESCRLLVEQLCNMELKTNGGQTVYDVAAPELGDLLHELKEKQATLRTKEENIDLIQNRTHPPLKRRLSDPNGQNSFPVLSYFQQQRPRSETIPRDNDIIRYRSSVTRMSNDQKQNIVLKNVEEERAQLEANKITSPSSSSSSEEDESDSETEKQNEINKKPVVDTAKKQDTSVAEHKKPANINMPKIEENAEVTPPSTPRIKDFVETTMLPEKDVPKPSMNDVKKEVEKSREEEKPEEVEPEKPKEVEKPKEEERPVEVEKPKEIEKPKEVEKHEEVEPKEVEEPKKEEMPKEPVFENDREKVPSHIKQLPNATKVNLDNQPQAWRSGLRKTNSSQQVPETPGFRDNRLHRSLSSPFLGEKQEERLPSRRPLLSASDASSVDNTANERRRITTPHTSYLANATSSTAGSSITNTPANRFQQSSYMPYSRRRNLDGGNDLPTSAVTTTTTSITSITTTSTSTPTVNSVSTRGSNRTTFTPPQRDEEAESQRKAKAKRARETRRSTQGVTMEDLEKAEQALAASDTRRPDRRTRLQASEDKNRLDDNRSDKENKPEDTWRRSTTEDKKDENNTRGSFRSRHNRDITSDYSSSRIRPPSTASDTGTTGSTLTHRPSYRERVREQQKAAEEEKKEESKDKEQEKDEKSTVITRRQRRERRRPTGKLFDDDDNKEEKKETDDKAPDSSRSSKYGLGFDYSSSRDRQTSPYYSRSTTSTTTPDNKDFKKLYDDEHQENDRLRADLSKAQTEIGDQKQKIDDMKKERRTLERKMSERDEELKAMDSLKAEITRLKEENGALIRVISKLSK